MKHKKITKDTFNPKAFTFIDLGLPSGRLWATENAPCFYTYDEAVDTFGELLPKGSAMVELIEESTCTWNDEKKGLDITGPNGNTIFLPAAGYTWDSLVKAKKAKDKEGDYWTRMPYSTYARGLGFYSGGLRFYSDGVLPLYTGRCSYGFSVRLCQESDFHKKQIKNNDVLVWHPGYEPYPTPSERGSDVQLLLKVENLPVPYLTVTWDGHNLFTFSTFGYPDSPWTSFPEGIKIESWAVLL